MSRIRKLKDIFQLDLDSCYHFSEVFWRCGSVIRLASWIPQPIGSRLNFLVMGFPCLPVMFFPNRNFAASDGTRTPLVSAVVTKKKRAIALLLWMG
jgi:hypothetical protein